MIRFVTDDAQPHAGGNRRYGDIASFTPTLWTRVVERFAVRSVLDVGCGEGQAVWYFHRMGLVAHGIDALRKNVARAVHPIAYHDLTTGPYIMPVDLVMSIEVAEHIEAQYVDNYITTLCNGRVIVMTHALPGQDGYHHVNCQEQSYWVKKLSERGYHLDPHTHVWQEFARRDFAEAFFVNSGLVFIADD